VNQLTVQKVLVAILQTELDGKLSTVTEIMIKKVNVSYSWANNLKNMMVRGGYITETKNGRMVILKLTEIGKVFAEEMLKNKEVSK